MVRRQPPCDLSALLKDRETQKPWMESFKRYLAEKKMENEIQLLEFMADCHKLETELDNGGDQEELQGKYDNFINTYLGEDSQVSFCNSSLPDDVRELAYDTNLSAKKDAIKELRNDPDVGPKVGKAYNMFKATNPVTMAVVMAIFLAFL